MFNSVLGMFSNDLAIDLGTANTLVYARGKGVVCNEPSVVVVKSNGKNARTVLAVGQEAKAMRGKTPLGVKAMRPLRDGVIADYEVTQDMLRYFIRRAHGGKSFVRPRVLICVPYGITEVEKRAVRESAESAGARKVYLVEEPMAAAIGVGLPVTEALGSMIVDIGGGTSEVAVISLKGVVYSKSLRVGGDKMDEAIINFLKRNYNLSLGEQSAEKIKMAIGAALPTGENHAIEVRGNDLVTGLPHSVELSEEDVIEALSEPLKQIVEGVRSALERTPPDLSGDIVDRGIMLTGGGSLLRNMEALLRLETGLPVILAEDPLTAVVNGSGKILDRDDILKDVALH